MGLMRAWAFLSAAWAASRRHWPEAEDVLFFLALALVAYGADLRWGRGVAALAAGGCILAVLLVRLVCAAWVTRAELTRGDGRD